MHCGKVTYEYSPTTDSVIVLENHRRGSRHQPAQAEHDAIKRLLIPRPPKRGLYNPIVQISAARNQAASADSCIDTRRRPLHRRRPLRNVGAPASIDEPEPDITIETTAKGLAWSYHQWLQKRGKASSMKEEREKMVLMRRWFEFLDSDGSGEIGIDELEDPLVSVGLAKCRNDVRKLIQTVDDSEDGEVNFEEFLAMMHGKKQTKERTQYKLSDPKRQPEVALRPQTERSHRPSPTKGDNSVVTLFTDLQAGKLGDLTLPFPILITAYRRRMLLNAHMAPDVVERCKGQSVLSALETTRRDALAAESARDTKVREKPGLRLVDRAGVLRRQDVEDRRSSLRRGSTHLDDEVVHESAKPKPKLGLFLPDLFN